MDAFHKFLDHTADILFVAKAPTLNELFAECGLATEETMVNIERVKPKETIKILGESHKVDMLLFDFIDELIFFKDYKQLIFSKFDVDIKQSGDTWNLVCTAHGEKLDLTRHEPKVDVKAVTMHLFKVEQVKDTWKAQVLLDI